MKPFKDVKVREVSRPLAGDVLLQIRRRKRRTLREFCIVRGLDPMRYSMIERNLLYPTPDELEQYLALVGPDPSAACLAAERKGEKP